ncbi:MAG: outer membrane beta-barrel protein, partial [Gammaproteobacteria bacterium]|nr:outer membrane beta-barrel protein [Gammaproteobacteria bacterium]
KRKRIPTPGIVITSETYLRFDFVGHVSSNGQPALEQVALVEVFDVYRIELAGNISSAQYRELERIALTGIISNYDEYEVARRYVLAGSITNSELIERLQRIALAGTISSYEEYELARRFGLTGRITNSDLVERLERIALAGTISSYDQFELARRYGLDGTITNLYQELVERYGLTGIISNTDDSIELAYLRREDAPPQKILPGFPELIDEVVLPPVVRDGSLFWSRSRDLFAIIEPTLTTFIRRDEIDRDGTAKEGSTLVVVRPYLRLALQQPRWSLTSHYELESATYLSGDDDGFINHEVAADWGFRPSRENQINVGAVYRNWHDRRTSQAIEDFNAGLLGSFDYDSLGFDFGFRHGTNQDRKHYEVSARTQRTRVDSEADGGSGYDLIENNVKATGYWRVRRRITLLLDGGYKNFDYEDRDDSRQFRVSTGVEFLMPRRIKGSVLAGYENKRHADLGLDSGALVWNADLSWRPWRKTMLEFRAAGELLEVFARAGTILAGEFAIQQSGRLSWSQQWNSAWDSKLSLSYLERDFEGVRREEEAMQLIFGASYRATPRLTLRGDGVYTNQRAFGAPDFDRWTVTLRADMGLYRGRR